MNWAEWLDWLKSLGPTATFGIAVGSAIGNVLMNRRVNRVKRQAEQATADAKLEVERAKVELEQARVAREQGEATTVWRNEYEALQRDHFLLAGKVAVLEKLATENLGKIVGLEHKQTEYNAHIDDWQKAIEPEELSIQERIKARLRTKRPNGNGHKEDK